MKLKELLLDYPCQVQGDRNMDIADICRDSQQATPGCLFFCIVGFRFDGHAFAKAAAKAGAAALVVTHWLPELAVTQILVEDDRAAMATFSANFFGRPAEKMTMVGVTGTNGKTTTTYLCAQVAQKLGKKVGMIGTIHNKIIDRIVPTQNTTPESLELQKLLKEMVDAGVEVVFMEVSSHSLALKRVFGIGFAAGAFTNLTRDHLDFHKTMENYMFTKSMLFAQSNISILNADDGAYGIMSESAQGDILTYGIKRRADFQAIQIKKFSWGNEFIVNGLDYEIGIPGEFSVYNGLCTLAICSALGYDKEKTRQELQECQGISGRAQVLKSEGYTIILDYAHTPDGLENILKTFREFGRLVVVFGAGGGRDKQKRPIMGAVVGKNADYAIITSDNPRDEAPLQIMQEIEAGIQGTDIEYAMIENRKQAIRFALQNAREGDIIILAGKGHETYQEIGGVRQDFDETKIVPEILKEIDSK